MSHDATHGSEYGWGSVVAEPHGDDDGPPEHAAEPSQQSAGDQAAGDREGRGRRGHRSQKDSQAKRLGKALLAILRYDYVDLRLSAAELRELLRNRHSEKEIGEVLRGDPRLFAVRPRVPADANGWTEYEYTARLKTDSWGRW